MSVAKAEGAVLYVESSAILSWLLGESESEATRRARWAQLKDFSRIISFIKALRSPIIRP